jgi:carbonic anhydrase
MDNVGEDSETAGSRGELLAGAPAGAAALGDVASAGAAVALHRRPRRPHPRTPHQALEVLRHGNRRYRQGRVTFHDYSPVGEDRANDQKPFAAIITCADSRVSPSIVFDIELGNMFVSRIAGNSIDVGTLGSTEYAVKVLGVKAVMVLAHSDCGAIKAGIGVANGTSHYPPDRYGAIGKVVDGVVPPIKRLPPHRRTLHRCIRANARAQAAELAASKPIIKPAIEAGKLRVVAAVYEIGTGRVVLL